ncbi:MAG: GTPase Era, partial [Burkholderiales bacterium]
RPAVLALNKTDRLRDRDQLLPLMARIDAEHRFEALVPISASRGEQLERLLEVCAALLPVGPSMFDADDLTDRPERFLAAEMVREKLFRLTGDELPYACTVVIDEYLVQARARRIRATILVGREAHKPIVLGRGGERIKRIGTEARAELERLLGVRVHLELWVKVRSGWADTEQSLRAYGYE